LIRIDDEAGILLNDYSVYSDDDYFLWRKDKKFVIKLKKLK
jgi:hypothetical protein